MIVELRANSIKIVSVDLEKIVDMSIVVSSGMREIISDENIPERLKIISEYGNGEVVYLIAPEFYTETDLVVKIAEGMEPYTATRRDKVKSTEVLKILYKKGVK